MEHYDPNKAQQVWQRVTGQEPEQLQNMQALAVAELNEAAVYWLLSQQLQGKERSMLRRIFEEDQAHAACLKGIHYFVQDQPLSVRPVLPAPETLVIALRKSYARKRNALQAYISRASDSQYGCVFRILAQEEEQHCKTILQIVGHLKKGA